MEITPAPAEPDLSIEWDEDWNVTFNCDYSNIDMSNYAGYSYFVTVTGSRSFEDPTYNSNYSYTYDVSAALTDSGIYKATGYFVLLGEKDGIFGVQDSYTILSEEKEYTRPAAEMPQTIGIWNTSDGYKLEIPTVENATEYYVQLYKENDNNEFVGGYSQIIPDDGSETITLDYTNYIQAEGRYKVSIRTCSPNVDEIANSREAFSAILDTKTYTTEVSNTISDIIADATAEEALAEIKETYTTNALVAAMQTDDDVVDLISGLENQYAADKGITVNTAVSDDAAAYIDTNGVSVVGAALNATTSNITLDVSLPSQTEKENVSQYDKSVVLDIKLLDGTTELHDLEVPVTITLTIPENIAPDNLVIIHYTSGSKDIVKYVFADEDKTTVKFTVGSFSMFEFADKDSLKEEPAAPTAPPQDNNNNNNNNNSNNNNNNQTSNTDQSAATPAPTTAPAAATAPKTNDPAILVGWFMLLCATGIILTGKKSRN